MKKYILAAATLFAAISASAQAYQVVITETDGTQKAFSTTDVSSIKFTETPQYIEANYLISAYYNLTGTLGGYSFTIATGAPDKGGDPANVGDIQVQLNLIGTMSEDASNAIIPEGYYRNGVNEEAFTVYAYSSGMWIRTEEGEDGVAPIFFTDTAVDVVYEGDYTYEIRITATSLAGSEVNVRYHGKLEFTPGATTAVDFSQNQNVTFEGGQGRYFGNWFVAFADDITLQFYTGEFDEAGAQKEGYWLYIDAYMPKDESRDASWSPVVTDGVYAVEKRQSVTGQSYQPYTFMKGYELDLWGQKYNAGSYLLYTARNGALQRAYLVDGTMTVSNNGKTFEFDFVAENGIKVQGAYEGKPVILNVCDNSLRQDAPDTLEDDVVLDFVDNTVVLDYNIGQTLAYDINDHILMITDPAQQSGDYLMIELMHKDAQLPDGTYAVSDKMEDFSALKGRVNYAGELIYSWYGNLDSTDEEGYQTILAPIYGGTMTITTLDSGDRKYDFDFTTKLGHKLTGSITREENYIDYSQSSQVKKQTRAKMRKLTTKAQVEAKNALKKLKAAE